MSHNTGTPGRGELDLNITNAQWERLRRKLHLTPRQMQIVKLLFEAKQNKEIACDLKMNLDNVNKHLRRLYGRVQVSDRVELLIRLFKLILDGKT